MARTYSYKEALRILGAGESAVLNAADTASAAALLGLGVLDFFEARATLFELADKLRRRLGPELRGQDRLSRTERVWAACTVLAIVAVFEAIDQEWRSLGTSEPLVFTRSEQNGLSSRGGRRPHPRAVPARLRRLPQKAERRSPRPCRHRTISASVRSVSTS